MPSKDIAQRCALWITLLLTQPACSPQRFTSPEILPLDSPAQAPSGEPNLTIGEDGHVYLTWIQREAGGIASLMMSRLDSSNWSAPKVISSGNNWIVNWADFPALGVNENGRMMATWLQKIGIDTYAYGVRASLSADAGDTWAESFWLHGDTSETEHGFVSLVPGPEGSFDAIWLDGREMTRDLPMTLRHVRVDRDGARMAETVVDDRVCDCCQTSAARAEDGSLVAVYRDRSLDEVRDIAIVRFDGRSWSTPLMIDTSGWQIAGCPVNGPAITTRGSKIAVAWYTGADSVSPAVHLALATEGWSDIWRAQQIDQGNPIGRVDVAVAEDGTVFACWFEQSQSLARLTFGRIWPTGRTQSMTVAQVGVGRESGFPQIVHDGRRTVLAWTDPEKDRVNTAIITTK